MNLKEQYTSLYRDLLNSKEPRFIVFRPTDQSGWGNRLRGLTLCFLLSLCTKRILVVDDFLIVEHFEAPDGTDWSARKWRGAMGLVSDRKTMVLHLRPENWDSKEWESYASKSMESIFPQKMLILTEGIGFFDALIKNPYYEPFFKECGLDTSSKLSWLGKVCKYLLSRPKPKLLAAVRGLSKRLGMPLSPDVGVQFRSFYDIGSPNAVYINSFLQNIKEDISTRFKMSSDLSLYITSDDPRITDALSEGLKGLGRIMSLSHKTIHTGGRYTGLGRYLKKALAKILGEEAERFEIFFWLPERFRPRPHTRVLAEWFLLGECKRIYSTFSSFAAFAAARRGNIPDLIAYNKKKMSCENLRNEDYFF